LDDPRNPDCPCHKLQKLADDEYARLNRSSVKKEGSRPQNKKKTSERKRVKRKNFNTGSLKKPGVAIRRRSMTRGIGDISACFRF
jgi:hypothetical protein